MTLDPLPLELGLEGVAPLRDPALVIALSGWFDAASVATTALDHVGADALLSTIGTIDPDPFYDFTVERPMIEIVGDDDLDPGAERREIVWPANHVRCLRTGARGDRRDVVILNGVEPHLAWSTYVACVLEVVAQAGVGLVVTLGSIPDTAPHTRVPLVVGSTGDRHLAQRFGLARPTYQGVTGLVGVLHSELEARGVPSISLRVGVPHYAVSGEHPRAIAALVQHLAHVIDVALPVDLTESIGFWDRQHDQAIADDPQLRSYVRRLERDYDRRAEETVVSGDELAARFEELLRKDLPGGPGDDDPD
jgi:hypothetical protein